MCTFGLSGCRVKPRPGLHTTARELQTCTFQGPGASKHHQNSTRRPPERHRNCETVAGKGRKSVKFCSPHPSGLHPSGLQARPSFARTKFGQTKFGQDQVWPSMAGRMGGSEGGGAERSKGWRGQREGGGPREWRDNQYSQCFCEGDAFTETLLMSAFRVSTGLHVEHRRPKAGDAPHERLLKLNGGGSGVLGFWGFGV